MKNIQHYATYLQGGAGGAALRIFDGIRGESSPSETEQNSWKLDFICREDQELTVGHSKHFVPADSFFGRTLPKRLHRKSYKLAAQHYHEHLKNRPSEYEAFSPARLYEPTALQNPRDVSLIHLHWVAFLFDYISFFRSIPNSVPIVWTLHDMNAFTGGCHYSAGCDKYKNGCGSCFQLDNPHSNDLSAVAWSQKRKAYSKRDLTVVTPCEWLTELAMASGMYSPHTNFETIHYGLDTDKFSPLNKEVAKQKLGLDVTKTTLLFGAADLSVHRKGWKPLLQALNNITNTHSLNCVVFGGGDVPQDDLASLRQKMDVKVVGFLDSDDDKRTVYSAANMFVLPSLEDNQPQTGLESLACGTPVVAFDTGGISEFVHHGRTGLLAPIANHENLAKQIAWLAADPETQQTFGMNGRELIVEQFEIQKQSKKYIKLYDKLLENQSAASRQAA